MRISDLFALGLGCDFVGAYLLGRGLLVSPGTIVGRSTPQYDFQVKLALGQAEDRVDAMAGIASLLAGFAIQAAGYALELARSSAVGTAADAGLLAGIAIVVAAGLLLVWERALRWPTLRRALIELSRWDSGTRHDLPSASRLQDFGMALGIGGSAREVMPGGPPLYARRVFGVAETR